MKTTAETAQKPMIDTLIRITDCRHQKGGAIRIHTDDHTHIANVTNGPNTDEAAKRLAETWNALAGVAGPQEAVKQMRTALEFYANPANHAWGIGRGNPMREDRGDKARAALRAISPTPSA